MTTTRVISFVDLIRQLAADYNPSVSQIMDDNGIFNIAQTLVYTDNGVDKVNAVDVAIQYVRAARYKNTDETPNRAEQAEERLKYLQAFALSPRYSEYVHNHADIMDPGFNPTATLTNVNARNITGINDLDSVGPADLENVDQVILYDANQQEVVRMSLGAFDAYLQQQVASGGITSAAAAQLIQQHTNIATAHQTIDLTPYATVASLTQHSADHNAHHERPADNRLIPAGGTSGQVLKKDSNNDYDFDWADDESGAGGGGRTEAQVTAAIEEHTGQSTPTGKFAVSRIPDIPATTVTVEAGGFNGNLATTDTNVQLIAQKLDDLVLAAAGLDQNAVDTRIQAYTGQTGPTTTVDVGRLPNRSAADIEVDASGFDGNLATTDTNVQLVAQKLDDLTVGGGGTATPLATTNPNPVSNSPQSGSGTAAARSDHQHALSIANGDVTGAWNADQVTLDFANKKLRDLQGHITGDGYTRIRGGQAHILRTSEPTLSVLTGASYSDEYSPATGTPAKDSWTGIRLTDVQVENLANIRVRAGTDAIARLVASSNAVSRFKGKSGQYSYYAVQVADIGLGETLSTWEYDELALDNEVGIRRATPDKVGGVTLSDVHNPVPPLVSKLPYGPSIGTTNRIFGVQSYPQVVTMTITRTSGGNLTGNLEAPLAVPGVSGLQLTRLEIYQSSYTGALSSLRNDRVFGVFNNVNNDIKLNLLFNGVEHPFTATYLSGQSQHEHENPTLNPEDFNVGDTFEVQIYNSDGQNPADAMIGVDSQETVVTFEGNQTWAYSSLYPAFWARQGLPRPTDIRGREITDNFGVGLQFRTAVATNRATAPTTVTPNFDLDDNSSGFATGRVSVSWAEGADQLLGFTPGPDNATRGSATTRAVLTFQLQDVPEFDATDQTAQGAVAGTINLYRANVLAGIATLRAVKDSSGLLQLLWDVVRQSGAPTNITATFNGSVVLDYIPTAAPSSGGGGGGGVRAVLLPYDTGRNRFVAFSIANAVAYGGDNFMSANTGSGYNLRFNEAGTYLITVAYRGRLARNIISDSSYQYIDISRNGNAVAARQFGIDSGSSGSTIGSQYTLMPITVEVGDLLRWDMRGVFSQMVNNIAYATTEPNGLYIAKIA